MSDTPEYLQDPETLSEHYRQQLNRRGITAISLEGFEPLYTAGALRGVSAAFNRLHHLPVHNLTLRTAGERDDVFIDPLDLEHPALVFHPDDVWNTMILDRIGYRYHLADAHAKAPNSPAVRKTIFDRGVLAGASSAYGYAFIHAAGWKHGAEYMIKGIREELHKQGIRIEHIIGKTPESLAAFGLDPCMGVEPNEDTSWFEHARTAMGLYTSRSIDKNPIIESIIDRFNDIYGQSDARRKKTAALLGERAEANGLVAEFVNIAGPTVGQRVHLPFVDNAVVTDLTHEAFTSRTYIQTRDGNRYLGCMGELVSLDELQRGEVGSAVKHDWTKSAGLNRPLVVNDGSGPRAVSDLVTKLIFGTSLVINYAKSPGEFEMDPLPEQCEQIVFQYLVKDCGVRLARDEDGAVRVHFPKNGNVLGASLILGTSTNVTLDSGAAVISGPGGYYFEDEGTVTLIRDDNVGEGLIAALYLKQGVVCSQSGLPTSLRPISLEVATKPAMTDKTIESLIRRADRLNGPLETPAPMLISF